MAGGLPAVFPISTGVPAVPAGAATGPRIPRVRTPADPVLVQDCDGTDRRYADDRLLIRKQRAPVSFRYRPVNEGFLFSRNAFMPSF